MPAKLSDEGYTYNRPDEKKYFTLLLKVLASRGEQGLVDILKGCRCAIRVTSSYSRKRWNAYWTTVNFYVPFDRLERVTEEAKLKLIKVCDEIMPQETGLDVMNVEFTPSMDDEEEQSLVKDLENAVNSKSNEIIGQILPDDIRDKGKSMAEAYLYLYCVENSLRLFLDSILRNRLSEDYFSKLKIGKEVRDKIASRKDNEKKNKWLSLRGDSDLFYLDFKDIGLIISSNWELFADYFPSQQWILSKISELAECRNLVAHNSFIGDHEKDVIRVNFNSILKQIGASS